MEWLSDLAVSRGLHHDDFNGRELAYRYGWIWDHNLQTGSRSYAHCERASCGEFDQSGGRAPVEIVVLRKGTAVADKGQQAWDEQRRDSLQTDPAGPQAERLGHCANQQREMDSVPSTRVHPWHGVMGLPRCQ